MIPNSQPLLQVPDWQIALRQAIREPAELLEALQLGHLAAKVPETGFALRVPAGYVARMRPGDPADPLLRQVLPLDAELASPPGYSLDAVGDQAAMTLPGLLQKYQGRALLIATGACAIHCRYCFRRHFPYEDASACGEHWQAALEWLATEPTITEIILSGGDPLLLSDKRLDALLTGLEALPHIQTLRIHSRLPVVLPQRITDTLCQRLAASRLQTVMVIHANHAREADATVFEALQRLRQLDITLLNQAVLLKGVNDSVEAQLDLAKTFFRAGVLPYYLHQLDRVQGTAHFEVSDQRALEIHKQLHASLPGYLVPKLVREQAGAPGKTPLNP